MIFAISPVPLISSDAKSPRASSIVGASNGSDGSSEFLIACASGACAPSRMVSVI